jgi:hypothetical protein
MEKNWLIIIIAIVAITALIIFLIIQNKKDKKALMRNLIEEDNISIPVEPDNEVDSTE